MPCLMSRQPTRPLTLPVGDQPPLLHVLQHPHLLVDWSQQPTQERDPLPVLQCFYRPCQVLAPGPGRPYQDVKSTPDLGGLSRRRYGHEESPKCSGNGFLFVRTDAHFHQFMEYFAGIRTRRTLRAICSARFSISASDKEATSLSTSSGESSSALGSCGLIFPIILP
jgi:hypothetical protein